MWSLFKFGYRYIQYVEGDLCFTGITYLTMIREYLHHMSIQSLPQWPLPSTCVSSYIVLYITGQASVHVSKHRMYKQCVHQPSHIRMTHKHYWSHYRQCTCAVVWMWWLRWFTVSVYVCAQHQWVAVVCAAPCTHVALSSLCCSQLEVYPPHIQKPSGYTCLIILVKSSLFTVSACPCTVCHLLCVCGTYVCVCVWCVCLWCVECLWCGVCVV